MSLYKVSKIANFEKFGSGSSKGKKLKGSFFSLSWLLEQLSSLSYRSFFFSFNADCGRKHFVSLYTKMEKCLSSYMLFPRVATENKEEKLIIRVDRVSIPLETDGLIILLLFFIASEKSVFWTHMTEKRYFCEEIFLVFGNERW